MNVLVVSGIWPPDVGGPASHAPEFASFLAGRGHGVEVVVTADAPPARERYPVRFVSRKIPVGARHAAVAALVTRRARHSDVVYATSMLGRSILGAGLAHRPVVVKLVADEAYERARRRGLYDGDLDAFQSFPGTPTIRALRAARDVAIRRVDHLVCPSAYLARLAVGWGVPAERVTVLPNPSPKIPPLRPRTELRDELGIDGPTLAFAGRITRQKALGVLLAALAACPDVQLMLAGDGPDLPAVRVAAAEAGVADRVRFLGSLDRVGVLQLFAAADASVLSSSWENFPHTVVEALAVGTPVIATAAGGVAEIVADGGNGLLVPVGDHDSLGVAIRRYFSDDRLRDRLRGAASASVEHLGSDVVYAGLESLLAEVAR